ncbi:hypothetical protein RMCBS344292_05349 [Rhizopus microsporus]|nr:hypothetical protein RMCBS344292_05349 [Rhizopus microsporus]
MFLCRHRLVCQLNKSNTTRYITTRFGSSSCDNDAKEVKLRNKGQEKSSTNSNDNNNNNNNNKKRPLSFVPVNNNNNNNKKRPLSFVPVINIPEKELAHNAFFALHRPLLGLSNENTKPFFSSRPLEEDQQAEYELLAQYMSTLEPFVEPLPPGSGNDIMTHQPSQPSSQFTEVSIQTDLEYMDDLDLEFTQPLQTEDVAPTSQLPIFRMPESSDILDFLTTVESKLHREGAKIDQKEAIRLKKLDILNNSRRYTSPRFYASGLRRTPLRFRSK